MFRWLIVCIGTTAMSGPLELWVLHLRADDIVDVVKEESQDSAAPENQADQGKATSNNVAVVHPIAAIEAALASRETLDFTEISLFELCDFLQRKHAIQVFIDLKTLESGDHSTKQNITIVTQGITLESALRLTLPQAGLGYGVQNESLIFTSIEAANELQETRIYPIGDLLGESMDGFHTKDLFSIREMLCDTIETDSWNEVGGPGIMDVHSYSSSLICRQNRRVLQLVQEALDALRQICAEQKATNGHGKQAVGQQTVVRVYRLQGNPGGGDSPPPASVDTETAKQLEIAIRETIAPDRWINAGGEGVIRAVGSSLFVRQEPAIHDQIREALKVYAPLATP